MDKPVADMVLVPREPTDEMLQAFEDEYVCMFGAAPPSPWSKAEKLFAAMIAAAPQPSLEGEVGELVERLDAQAWEHKLTGIVRQKHDKPSIGMDEGDYEPLVRRSDAAAILQSLSADNARLREERDAAQADAYKANKAADAINVALKDAGDRAAKIWCQFRDLRIEITGDGPMCRDCADFDGRCQGNGRPCDPDEAVKEQIAKWKADGFRDKVALGATTDEILRFRDGYPNPSGGSKIIYRYTIEQARYRYADAVIAARSTAIKGNGNG